MFALSLGVIILLFSGCPNPPAVVNYPITGQISFFNECDGQQASIPNQVTVTATLLGPNNTSVGVPQTINLAPDPAQPNAPLKIGTYTIVVPWSGAGPNNWKRMSITPSCEAIACPDVTKVCIDFATATGTFPIGNPTVRDFRISCGCSGN